MKAGALQSKDLQNLLTASYVKHDTGKFTKDRDLSTKTSKVFTSDDGQVVVVHRGTQGISDWANNAAYALGGNKLYKQTSRFKEAEAVQKAAAKKYGAENISTIGHSQGGLQAELLGKDTKEIITLNKASRPGTNRPRANQTDIQTRGDMVSAFSKPDEIIEADLNPLAAHSVETLGLTDQIFGEGLEVGGDNVTTDGQLNDMLSHVEGFRGCFTADTTPSAPGFYCVNLNGQSHWCGLLRAGKDSEWFDAYGFPAPQSIKIPYIWSDADMQSIDSSACGYYVVAYILWRASGKTYESFLMQFHDDPEKNEKRLADLLHHL